MSQKNWVESVFEDTKTYISSQRENVSNSLQATKKEICKTISPAVNQVQEQKDLFVNEYEKLMDPQTRQYRDMIVFWPTFTVGFMSTVFIRRPRKVIRYTLFTYTMLSLAFCKENFNPLK